MAQKGERCLVCWFWCFIGRECCSAAASGNERHICGRNYIEIEWKRGGGDNVVCGCD